MMPIVVFAGLLCPLAFATTPGADKPDVPAVDPVQTAFDKLVRAATDTDWPAEKDARQELSSLGQAAVPKLTAAARSHGETRVRRACYELLTTAFANDERAVGTVVRYGLLDHDAQVRYQCAFLLGDLKVRQAEPVLRAALEGATGKDDAFVRFTLAKSLAQLGAADVLPTLFAAVSDDSFMARHVGNIGLKRSAARTWRISRAITTPREPSSSVASRHRHRLTPSRPPRSTPSGSRPPRPASNGSGANGPSCTGT